jgi:hypothetical protein
MLDKTHGLNPIIVTIFTYCQFVLSAVVSFFDFVHLVQGWRKSKMSLSGAGLKTILETAFTVAWIAAIGYQFSAAQGVDRKAYPWEKSQETLNFANTAIP